MLQIAARACGRVLLSGSSEGPHMANGPRLFNGFTSFIQLPAAAALAVLAASSAFAEPPSLEDLLSAVVRIKTYIPPDARTVQGLGKEREGSGIVIDQSGLILTI